MFMFSPSGVFDFMMPLYESPANVISTLVVTLTLSFLQAAVKVIVFPASL
jgi:hypothetical protein